MARKRTKPPDSAEYGEIWNKARLAFMLGCTVKRIDRMIAVEGLPVLHQPANRNGEYRFSSAQVFHWVVETADRRQADPRVDDLATARADLAKAQAEGQTLRNAKMREDYLPADEVAYAWEMSCRRATEVMRKVPAEAAGILDLIVRNPNTAAAELAVRAHLTAAIDGALNELADTRVLDEAQDEAVA